MPNDVLPTPEERERLADLLAAIQLDHYDNRANRAYGAAGLNSATWKRLTAGLTVKPTTLTDVAKFFWPETRGDWQRIPGIKGTRRDRYKAEVAAWETDAKTRDALLRVLEGAPDLDEDPVKRPSSSSKETA